MKETIKNFMDVFYKRYDMAELLPDSELQDELKIIMLMPEFTALKSLANAPVAKVEVTDEMKKKAAHAIINYENKRRKESIFTPSLTYTREIYEWQMAIDIAEAALEAVFSMQELVSVRDINETNFVDMPKDAENKAQFQEKELISDGWIDIYVPKNHNPAGDKIVDVRTVHGEILNIPAIILIWESVKSYRIISDPEEKKEQTLLEFLHRMHGNLDTEVLSTLFASMSEYLEKSK